MSAPPQTAVQEQRIEQCQGLVRALAVQIHHKLPATIELDDLVAYGELGLVEAARSFDPGQGCQFSTYAYYRIRGSIYDGAAKMSWGLRDDAQDAPPAPEPEGAARTADREPMRLPHGGEAPPPTRRREGRRSAAVVSLSQPAGEGLDALPDALVDLLQPGPSAEAIASEIRDKLQQLIDTLPQAAAELIRATYFEGLTLEEAGHRLGLSKSWASRVRAQALRTLARALAGWGPS